MQSDSRNATRCASSRLLTILTAVSAALLVVLGFGYVLDVGLLLRHNASGTSRGYYEITIGLQRGRAVIWEQHGQTPVTPPFAGWGLRWRGSLLRPHVPDMKRSLWEFDD